jgi:hypothetical protein
MVRAALRQYRMDVVTNDMQQVRQFMAAHGAPSDYVLTKGLARLELAGGGFLRWRNQPVAMVCFHGVTNQMLYLFVLEREAVKDPPPAAPRLTKINKLLTATWTQGEKTCLLAGPEEPDFGRKYLTRDPVARRKRVTPASPLPSRRLAQAEELGLSAERDTQFLHAGDVRFWDREPGTQHGRGAFD